MAYTPQFTQTNMFQVLFHSVATSTFDLGYRELALRLFLFMLDLRRKSVKNYPARNRNFTDPKCTSPRHMKDIGQLQLSSCCQILFLFSVLLFFKNFNNKKRSGQSQGLPF